MIFHLDLKALATALGFAFLLFAAWKWKNRYQKPAILFSDVEILRPRKANIKQMAAHLPNLLKYTALLLFILAWIDPHTYSKEVFEEAKLNPTEGIAIYLVLDQSGSMMERVTMQLPDGRRSSGPKIDLLKKVTESFIKQHPNDLLGLISFARRAHIQVPLTLDHQEVIQKMLQLQPLTGEEERGSAMGYATYKTANLIVATKHFAEDLIKKGEEAYEIKNSIIVLVTDGVQTLNPEDRDNPLRTMDIAEAAAYAKENKIKLYIINIDPSIKLEELGPQRRLIQRSAESTGGKFYIVDGVNSLGMIYNDIDRIEKGLLPPQGEVEEYLRKNSFYSYLIASGLVCLFVAVCLSTTLLAKTP